MIDEQKATSGDEQILEEILAAYLKAMEAGTPPDQQELLARYPELAAELSAFFAEHEALRRLTEAVRTPPALPAAGAQDLLSPTRAFEAGPSRATVLAAQGERYGLKHFHARGGMGEVWLAEDRHFNRLVALKRLRTDRPGLEERFGSEARITGQLEHPAIVPVHDLGQDAEGHPFYVMKFVRGRTLKEAIRHFYSPDGPTGSDHEVEWKRLLAVFVDLCQAVAFAHSRGVVHRDLKPDNVMLGPYGETLVLDWGLAKLLAERETSTSGPDSPYVRLMPPYGSSETCAGAVVGAPPYMAPEVAEGHADTAGPPTDVYLLGATLYEILTGHPPRRGSSHEELVELAKTVDPAPPRRANSRIARPLEAICLRAIARRPEDRYPAAEDLARDVERFLADEPVSAYRERVFERAWRWTKRHRKALGRSAATALVAAALLFGFVQLRQARRLEEQKTAQDDARRFRYLKDETQFYIGGTDAPDERVPYFDLQRGEVSAQAALAAMQAWGDRLERLPLDAAECRLLQEELYELLLLRVQARLCQEPGEPRELLTLLDRAASLAEPSRSYYRLQAQVLRLLKEDARAGQSDQLADDPATRSAALDHFLLGESYRTQLAGAPDAAPDGAKRPTQQSLLAQAVKAYYEALEIDPHHYWSHLQLGRCYLGLGRRAEAVEALSTCIALKPDAPWGYSTRGLAWALLGRFDEAERDLKRAAAQHPDFLPARLNYGVALWLQGKHKYAQALQEFQAASRASPEERALIEAAFCRGQIYLELVNLAQAMQEFDSVVSATPRFRPVYAIRAKTQFLLGQDEAGLDDLTTLARLETGPTFDPTSARAYEQRGRRLLHLGSELPLAVPPQLRGSVERRILDLSLQELQKAVELGSRSAALFDDLGVAWERFGRVPDAIQAYSQGLKLAPDQIKLRVKRGWAYVLAERYAEGQADFARALEQDPAQPWARSGLGYAHARLKAPADAGMESLYALLHGADDYLVLHNLACIQVRLSLWQDGQPAGRRDLAMALLHRALERAKQDGAAADELEQIRRESDFEPLRSRPDFQRLLAPAAVEHD